MRRQPFAPTFQETKILNMSGKSGLQAERLYAVKEGHIEQRRVKMWEPFLCTMCLVEVHAGTCIKAFQNIYVSRESIDKERNNARTPGGTQSVSQMIAARCHLRLDLVVLLQASLQWRQVYDAEHHMCDF